MKFSVEINRQNFNEIFKEEEAHYKSGAEHLGAGELQNIELPKLIKKYQENVVSVEEPSRIISITDQNFITANLQLPFTFQEDFKQYNFYWIEFPVLLHSPDTWKFTKVEVALSFNNNEQGAFTKPKIFKIFPDTTFQELFKVEAGGEANVEVGLDANLNFAASIPASLPVKGLPRGDIKVDAGAEAKGKIKFSVGPFSYTIKKAIITHNVTGANEIFWKLNQTNYLKENNLKLVVILQAPKDIKHVEVETAIVAYKNKIFAPAEWYEYITKAGDAFKSWFDADLPVPFEKKYDLSTQVV